MNRRKTEESAEYCRMLFLCGLLLAGAATLTVAAYEGPQVESLAVLRENSSQPVDISFRAGFPSSVNMSIAAIGDTPVERARNFLTTYSDFYLQNHPDVKMVHIRTDEDSSGAETVRMGQTYKGFPVFAAEIVIHLAFDPLSGPRVLRTDGALFKPAFTHQLPPLENTFDMEPDISVSMAEDAARAELGRSGAEIRGTTILMVHDDGLFQETSDPRLVYRVTVAGSPPIQALVDASTSAVVLRHSLDPTALDLDLEHAHGGEMASTNCFNPTTIDEFIGDEGGIVQAYINDADAVRIWFAAHGTHNFYMNNFGRDSYDGDNGEIEAYVHSSHSNASGGAWCGVQFATGWASRDVYAHEVTHMVTDETSDLIYLDQPGALNEAFSDIMAVSYDSQDWLLAEDRTNGMGAIRSVSNPPAFNCRGLPCPDRMSQFFNLAQWQDWGGVHTNSNIINKAFYLISEGGTFNGVPVGSGMGRSDMKLLAYFLFATLPRGASFNQARGGAIFITSNQWLFPFFNAQDTCTVRNAFAAVEIGMGDSNCDGIEDNNLDTDQDGILNDGNNSGFPTDKPCNSLQTVNCDDNCPLVKNFPQYDFDDDGIGDACDPDDDGDGIPNGQDLCPGGPGDQRDTDGDTIPNCLEADSDGDGIDDDGDGTNIAGDNPCPNLVNTNCDDNCRWDINFLQVDGNNNGMGDACDPDFDDDGLYGPIEDNCPWDWNPTQTDTDGDGLGDACDKCPDVSDNSQTWSPGIPMLDQDPAPIQPDSDGDGVPDACDNPAFYNLGVLINDSPYFNLNGLDADGNTSSIELSDPSGAGGTARLSLHACTLPDPPDMGAMEATELTFTGFPAGVTAWIEDGSGQTVRRIKVSPGDPSLHGTRFRPRCNRNYYLMLRTDAGFTGSATFNVSMGRVPTDDPNQWNGTPPMFSDPPEPLPDEDVDGIPDMSDNCPSTYDPTNFDRDGDGFGDACDVCPAVANPSQQPVPFPTITAVDTATLRWSGPLGYDYIKGPLSGLSSWTIIETGSVAPGDTYTMADGDESTFYLFKGTDCGTWGSAARDSVLP